MLITNFPKEINPNEKGDCSHESSRKDLEGQNYQRQNIIKLKSKLNPE